MNVLKYSWVPFAFAVLGVLFLLSAVANWEVGNLWGSNSVLVSANNFRFLPGDITSGHLWGSALVALGFFQFLVFGWFLRATSLGEGFAAVVLFFACAALTVLSFYTGVFWQAGNVDLMTRKAEATTSSFNNIRVDLSELYQKTHDIAPRGAAVISADIDQLMNKRISIRGKRHTLKSYSNTCQKVRWGTHDHCERFFALKKELAISKDYAANKAAIDDKTETQTDLLVLDPNAGFKFISGLTSVETAKQKTYRTLIGQGLIELFTLLGLSFIRWGLRYSGHKRPAPEGARQPLKTTRNDESFHASISESELGGRHVAPPAFKVIEGGKQGKFAVCDDSSLIEFVCHVGDTGFLRVHDFMDKYKAFCKARKIKPLGKNVVGTLLERCGGEKGRVTLYTQSGKQTYRKTWRLSADGLKQLRAA